MLMNANEYLETAEQVKQEIRTAQYRATIQVNCELLHLYHAIDAYLVCGAGCKKRMVAQCSGASDRERPISAAGSG